MNFEFLNILYQPLSQFEGTLYNTTYIDATNFSIFNFFYSFYQIAVYFAYGYFIKDVIYIISFVWLFDVTFFQSCNFVFQTFIKDSDLLVEYENLALPALSIIIDYLRFESVMLDNWNDVTIEETKTVLVKERPSSFMFVISWGMTLSFLFLLAKTFIVSFWLKIAMLTSTSEFAETKFDYYPSDNFHILDTSITKFHIATFFILFYFIIFFVLCFKNPKYYFRNWNVILFGMFDSFLSDTIIQQLGVKRGQKYSVFLKSIFFLILFGNVFGLIPFSFTITSHLIYTFCISFSIWLGITFLALYLQGFGFFKLFVPSGAPAVLLLLLVPIEIISYVARCFSLAIRLFANMMSGHTLLNILSGFVIKIAGSGMLLLALVPFLVVMAVSVLEMGIAFLQAYVFLVLVCIYLKDGFEAGH